MTKTSDRPPPPAFYNGQSNAIEAVNAIEAAKMEKRRARTTVTRETETKTEGGDSMLNNLALTKADIERFTKAAERRAGRTAYADWRIVSGVYYKARVMAKKESGQDSITNPVYKKIFSRIIKDLPPIAENEGTCEQYRNALLNIEEADAKDGKLEFSKWFEKHQPRAVNPVALWTGFRDRNKKPSTSRPRNGTNHQQELVRVQQEAADKISELMDRNATLSDQVRGLGGEPASEPSRSTAEASYDEKSSALDDLVRRAWREEAALWSSSATSNPAPAVRIFEGLLSRLASIAFDHNVIGDDERIESIDDVVATADDTIRNTYADWSGEQQAKAETDEDEDDAA